MIKKTAPDLKELDKFITHEPKYKICVSGAAETSHCHPNTLQIAEELGREIARQGFVLVTGATTGVPYWAAKGAKQEGGIVIGVSPAASKIAHLKTYRLPLEYHDLVIYTGFGYSGRDLLVVRAADATAIVCGRIGTLNEFTIAFEDEKIIGVLEGTGGIADMIKDITARANRGAGRIIFAREPKELVLKLGETIKNEEKKHGIKYRK